MSQATDPLRVKVLLRAPVRVPLRWLASIWVAAVPLATVQAGSYVWVDDQGVTHLSDDPAAVPEAVRDAQGDVDRVRALWGREILGPATETPSGGSGRDEDRVTRLLAGAADDLRRGETARAAATLRSVVRLDPARPEAHWHLAQLDLQRGRYESAESHLRAFLSSAGDDLSPWREAAERRLAALADERRLADTERRRGALRLVEREGRHFRVHLDEELEAASSRYAATVMRYLEAARGDVSSWIGVTPLEPLGVVFYGKAAYLRAHRHRFSFQTVGFFDGRIHVSSPAHPTGQLRSLLYHEYTHAVFRDQTGGDRPYWLNEGLAEIVERRSQGRPASTRSERASLRTRIEAGQWIPLRRLAPSFSGLSDEDARAAYLQAVVAVQWIEDHTSPQGRARLLERLGEGFSVDQALHEAAGVDSQTLDERVRAALRAEFPELAGASR